VRNPWSAPAAGDPVSPVLTKTVRSHFHKGLHCVPVPGTVASGTAAYVCTATGIDVDGAPFSGEKVCFSSTGGAGIQPYPPGVPFVQAGPNQVCLTLDANGQAAIQAFCKNQVGTINVNFTDEGITRNDVYDCHVLPITPTTTTTTTTTTTSTTTSTTRPTTTTTTAPTTTTTVPVHTTTTTTTRSTTTKPRPPADVCPNLAGRQVSVPKGKIKVHGRCVPKPKKIVVKAAKKVKKHKPTVCYIKGRPVSPCVRGKG